MVQGYTFVEGSLDEVVATLDSNNEFSLDLETTGLKPVDSRILLCQIGFRDSTFVIDAYKVNLRPLAQYFESRRWCKIIHKSDFERSFIKQFVGVDINNVFDTLLAEALLTTDQQHASKSLETLAMKYAGIKLDKSVRKGFVSKGRGMFTKEELQYAADDVICLFPIADAQRELLKEKEIEKVADLEFEVAQVVADMQLTGVPILIPKWKEILRETEAEHEESRLAMNALIFDEGKVDEQMGMFVRDGLNLNSPKQVKEAFNKIGIDIDKTNEREIGLIDHPAAKELLRYRGLQKILSAYGDTFLGFIHPFDQRIHADFMQLGTETGRFSCKEPNLQQMPDKFRQCVGSKDHVIIAADYSQIELRILAELSQDPNFLAAFNSGEDLHKSTAATMFGIPIDGVTKEQRFIAKTINFGLAYGMGSNKLMDILNAEAEKNGSRKYNVNQTRSLINKYKTAYSKVIEWLDNAGYLALRRGYSETMYGRRRYFQRPAQGIPLEQYEMQTAGIRRQGANSPIQGTNADITKLAMVEIYRELKNYGYSANIVIQVHDEIVILARREEAEAVRSIVVEAMVSAAEQLIKTVPVKVEAYISDVWKKG